MVTIIYDVNDLQDIELNLSEDYELGNDIDASPTQTWNYVDIEPTWWNSNEFGTFESVYMGFKPIGDYENQFTGSLDGKKYTISGLFIRGEHSSNYQGLFGICSDAGFKDVILDDCELITGDGSDYGIFIGNVTSTDAEISNITIKNSTVESHGNRCAVFAGLIRNVPNTDKCIVDNCVINVDKNTSSVGDSGIMVGHVWDSSFTNNVCKNSTMNINTGNYRAGVLTGRFDGIYYTRNFMNSYALDNIVNINSSNVHIAGAIGEWSAEHDIIEVYSNTEFNNVDNHPDVEISGFLQHQDQDNENYNILRCYFDEDRAGTSIGIYNDVTANDSEIYPASTTEMKNQSTYTDWDFNRGSGEWLIHSDINDGYPELQVHWKPYGDMAGGYGLENSPFQISDVNQLQKMEEGFDKYYELINDIDASDTVNWNNGEGFVPIGLNLPDDEYRCNFNGNFYTISKLYKNKSSNGGLFTSLYYSTIKNVILSEFNITGIAGVGCLCRNSYATDISNICCIDYVLQNSQSCTGGVCGYGSGGTVFKNVYSKGIIKSSGSVCGGIEGRCRSNMYNCFVDIEIENTKISGDLDKCGGLYGDVVQQSKIIENGLINIIFNGSFTNTGNLIGYIGGYMPDITSCYYNTDKNTFTAIGDADDSIYDVTGMVTDKLKYPYDFNAYKNWDFEKVWKEDDKELNDGYPILRSRYGNLIEYKVKHNGRWITPTLFGNQEYLEVGGIARTTTYVVAASDAPENIKKQADYICNGINDEIKIKEALDKGDEIHLSVGTFYLSSKLLITGHPKKLYGSSNYQTVLQYSGDNYAVEVVQSGTYARNIELGHFRIQFSGDAVGGLLLNSVKDCYFTDISISGSGYNIDVGCEINGGESGNWYNKIHNLSVFGITNADNTGKGLHIVEGTGTVNDSTISNSMFRSSDYNIYIESGNGHKFIGATAEGGTERTVYNNALTTFVASRFEGSPIENANSNGMHLLGVRLSSVSVIGDHADKVTIIRDNANSTFPYMSANSVTDVKILNNIHFSDEYDNLQEAIDSLGDHDILYIKSGTYNESINATYIRHNAIIGLGKVIINGGDSYAFRMGSTADYNSLIENITFRSDTSRALYFNGYDVPNTIIFRNIIIDSAGTHGIDLYASGVREAPTFENLTISGATDYGIYMHATTPEGGYQNLVLKNVNISNCGKGINANSRVFNITCENVNVYGLNDTDVSALYLKEDQGSVVTGGLFVPTGTGVPITGTSGNFISSNVGTIGDYVSMNGHNVVYEDISTGTKYRLIVDNEELKLQVVEL